MKQLQVVFLVLVAVLAAVAVPAVSAQTATDTPTETPTATGTPTANGSEADGPALGTQLTAFMQSSSAAANDSVENGMWKANFQRSEAAQRQELVTKRAGTLERRIERLEARNETLQQRYEDGTLSRQAYVAQQSRLSARIDSLESAVDDADTAATEAGVEDGRLERLKQSASELRGPEVAEIARGLAGGPKADVPGQRGPGPSNEADPSGTETEPNATKGPNERGAPENPGKGDTATPTETEARGASDDVLRRTLDAMLDSGFA